MINCKNIPDNKNKPLADLLFKLRVCTNGKKKRSQAGNREEIKLGSTLHSSIVTFPKPEGLLGIFGVIQFVWLSLERLEIIVHIGSAVVLFLIGHTEWKLIISFNGCRLYHTKTIWVSRDSIPNQ